MLTLGLFSGLCVALWSGWGRRLEHYAADPEYRARLIADHECRAASGYFNTLDRVLDWAQRFYVPPLSQRALGRCLTLAFVYPIAASLLAWVLVNHTAPGGVPLFHDVPDWTERLWRGGLALAGFVTAGWIFAKAERFAHLVHDGVVQVVDPDTRGTGFVSKAIARVIELLAVSAAGAGAVAFGGAVVFGAAAASAFSGAVAAGAGVVAMVFGFCFALVFAGTVAVGVAAVGAFIVAVTFAFGGAGNIEIAAILLFFYVLLPVANSVADFLSLAITRGFLTHMSTTRPGHLGLFLHFVVDLLAGLACLAALLTGMVLLLEVWAVLHPASLPFDWRSYWATARADSWQGITLWAMAFTTLLPTLVHVVWALTVWQTQKSDYTRRAVAMMHETDPPSAARCIEIADLLRWGKVSGVLRATIGWVPVFLVLLALMFGLTQLLGA